MLRGQSSQVKLHWLDLRSSSGSEPRSRRAKAGGGRRDRTDDLMLAKHALSQLSYAPVTRRRMLDRTQKTKGTPGELVGLGRLELPTSRLSSARSNQLSYKPLNDERLACGIASLKEQMFKEQECSRLRRPWRVFVREERET